MNNALLACSVGDIALLKRCLLSHSNPSATDKEGLNCLHLAAKNGHLDCLRYLLNNCSIDVNEAAAPSGYTALHFSVSSKTSGQRTLQCMKLLLERGTDQNRLSNDGQTALHVAARNGHIKCLKSLLERGADINITDMYEYVAYDVATQQGHFECARLLRALHWAERKDNELDSEIQDRVEQRRQERERMAINSRLRKEAAERAYQEWAQAKSKTTREPPLAYRERQERKSTSRACMSCKTTTRTSSGRQHSKVKLTSPIKVAMHQTRRNVDSTGKPAKLQPYTNSVPQRPQKSPASKRTRSGRSSRATNATTSPTPLSSRVYKQVKQQISSECTKQGREDTAMESIPLESVQSGDECGSRESPTHECHPGESTVNTPQSSSPLPSPPSQLNLGFLKKSSEYHVTESEASEDKEDAKVQFLIGAVEDRCEDEEEEEEEDGNFEDEDIPFHDVGGANSLNSLLTKHHSPAEVMQLLQYLGRTDNHSQSHNFRSRRRRSFSLQRRFSLGAIPEGQMVTNYSNESMTSLDEQRSRLRFIDLSPRGSRVWEEEEEDTLERAEVEGGKLQEVKCEDETEHSSYSSSADVEEDRVDMSEAGEERREGNVMSSATAASNPQMLLNIVNFVWDATSKSVQTSVIKSPMIPMRPSWQTSRSRPSSSHSPSWPVSAHSPSRPASAHSPSSSTSSQPRMQRPLSASSLTPINLSFSSRGVSENSPEYHESKPSHSNPPIVSDTLCETESSELSPQPTKSPLPPLLPSPPPSPSPPPTKPHHSLFAAHSLFSSSMSGIATKSMISLTVESVTQPSDHTNTSNQPELCHQPKMERRIKSAPNMLSQQVSVSQPHKTSVFTLAGRLQL